MVMGTGKGKALHWVRVTTRLMVGKKAPLGGQGFQLGRCKKSCCCKALNGCFHLIGRLASQPASHTWGSWKECVLLPGVGTLECQDSWSGLKSDCR